MNTNEIKFLPLDINENILCAKEPYLKEIIIYLNKNKIAYSYVEASINIPELYTNENTLRSIIDIVKTQRNISLQCAIKRNYL